jgi:hypothetical protein
MCRFFVLSDAEGGSGERGGPYRTTRLSALDARCSSCYPGGLRKGEAASTVPRPCKHLRNEARSAGRGMPSSRGLSRTLIYSKSY